MRETRPPFLSDVPLASRVRYQAGGSLFTRRGFLWTGATVGVAALATRLASGAEIGPVPDERRANQAYLLRHRMALEQRLKPSADHSTNPDDDAYSNKIGSFSKTLPHDALGEVNLDSYARYLGALSSGRSADFEAIPMGASGKLVNPQSAYAFDLMGADSHHLSLRVPPALASAEEAAEMAELYWQALTRDIPFAEFNSNGQISAAAGNLSAFSDFHGPKAGASVTPDTLFRGNTPGDLTGPYISQFLWKNVPYGLSTIEQRYRFAAPGVDFMTSYSEWLNVQNGVPPSQATTLDGTPRFMRSARDLAEWVHRDFTYQAFLNAALIVLGFGPGTLDKANPYRTSSTQSAFITFGGPEILDLVARAGRVRPQSCLVPEMAGASPAAARSIRRIGASYCHRREDISHPHRPGQRAGSAGTASGIQSQRRLSVTHGIS